MIGTRFFKTTGGPPPATPGRRAQLAGQLTRACADLGSRFEGEADGWRIVVDRVTLQRAMVGDDIGVPEPDEVRA
jgi:hypothetical protein